MEATWLRPLPRIIGVPRRPHHTPEEEEKRKRRPGIPKSYPSVKSGQVQSYPSVKPGQVQGVAGLLPLLDSARNRESFAHDQTRCSSVAPVHEAVCRIGGSGLGLVLRRRQPDHTSTDARSTASDDGHGEPGGSRADRVGRDLAADGGSSRPERRGHALSHRDLVRRRRRRSDGGRVGAGDGGRQRDGPRSRRRRDPRREARWSP